MQIFQLNFFFEGEIPTRHASKRQSPYTVDDLPKKKQATAVPGMSAAKVIFFIVHTVCFLTISLMGVDMDS